MKKTYVLNVEGKTPERLLEASKHDIRKYLRRERAKALPPGVDFWDFDCKVGSNPADALTVHQAVLTTSIDALIASGAEQFYVEIASKHGHRVSRPVAQVQDELATQNQGD